MNEFWYRIRRGAMYTASLLPFKVLYAISDLIYFIAYHIIRYRRRVVAKNLRNSFPEKGADELMCLAAYLAGNEQARAEAQQKEGKKA